MYCMSIVVTRDKEKQIPRRLVTKEMKINVCKVGLHECKFIFFVPCKY